ncbi:MAG: DUF2238 domain-containing protein [Planctomycetota bacterium]
MREPLILLALTALAMLWSLIGVHDLATWGMEVAPIFLGVPLLLGSARAFPLTPLLYRLLFVHAIILIVGAHYTYARVPLGFWMQDLFGFERNHYDRIGHLAQGFVPAILAREILLRRSPLVSGKWLFFIVVSICLAFSAFYELIEWWAALATSGGATDFLGTQGDVWDSQWDMFMALCGASAALLFLSRYHDAQLLKI